MLVPHTVYWRFMSHLLTFHEYGHRDGMYKPSIFSHLCCNTSGKLLMDSKMPLKVLKRFKKI